MKTIITILALILNLCTSDYSYSQFSSEDYNGTFQTYYFGRQPSARAEAMGRGFASVTGDALSYYYNPAGMASLKGLNVNGSYAQPYYYFDNADYIFLGASYSIKKYGNAAFSLDQFDYGYEDKIIYTDEYGNVTGSYDLKPKITNYRLTLSSEVIKDLFVGVNFNLLHPDLFGDISYQVGGEIGSSDEDAFYFDLGVIKSFNFKSKNLDHKVNLGTSLINVNSAKYTTADAAQADRLPVIFRYGAAYNLLVNDRKISSKLNSYNFLVNIEYEDLLNSKYYGGFHGGFEFTFLEILSLRAGYFTMENSSISYDTTAGIKWSDYTVNEFTYGVGLNIPVRQLTGSKTPIEIKLDFVSLKQPQYDSEKDDWKNFQVYTFTFNWIF